MVGDVMFSISSGNWDATPVPDAQTLVKYPPVFGETASSDLVYQAAVDDASVAGAAEAVNFLTVIDASNPTLTWKGVPGESRVLMVTYTDYHSAYEGHEGEDIVVGVELWLTASPDMKNYFAMTVTPENELSDRLDELLGLTPDSGNDLIVELWVDPGDLFRPSANPDITDSTGGTGSPATSYTLSTGQNYADWFDERLSWIYANSDGDSYPWTGLGYTYDWGNPLFDFGLSEFVLNKNSTVGAKDTYTVEEYLSADYAPTTWSWFSVFADAVPVITTGYDLTGGDAALLAAA